MTTQAYILMIEAEKDAATLLDGTVNHVAAMLGAQLIDNPMANNLGLGTLVGKWVAPARLLNDPSYARWVPTLGGLPIHVLDSETLFVPQPEV